MHTICVAGSASRAGKTEFAARLLSHLKDWAACKVTTCVEKAGQPCPRGGQGCGVCGSLASDFEIEEETGAAATSARDTGRLRAAGARRVLWVKARPYALPEAINAALASLEGAAGVLFEGNHVLTVLQPDVAVMVLSSTGRMKASAREVQDRVSLFARGPEDDDALAKVLRIVDGQ